MRLLRFVFVLLLFCLLQVNGFSQGEPYMCTAHIGGSIWGGAEIDESFSDPEGGELSRFSFGHIDPAGDGTINVAAVAHLGSCHALAQVESVGGIAWDEETQQYFPYSGPAGGCGAEATVTDSGVPKRKDGTTDRHGFQTFKLRKSGNCSISHHGWMYGGLGANYGIGLYVNGFPCFTASGAESGDGSRDDWPNPGQITEVKYPIVYGVPISYTISVAVQAYSLEGALNQTLSAEANFMDTFSWTIGDFEDEYGNPVDGYFESASGFDYSEPVPEPPGVLSLLWGMSAIALGAVRRGFRARATH
jgi:hypothetical protein